MLFAGALKKGFTIVESIVVIAIISFILLLTIVVVQNVLFGSNQQFLAVDNVDNAKSVTSRFVNEIRNAQVGVDGSFQINAAGDYQLIFYSKSSSDTVNRINYYISDAILYKGVTVPSGSPQVYNLASEVKSIVQRDVANQSQNTPLFTYHNGDYSGGSGAFVQPINVILVKFVSMNLMVLKKFTPQSQSTFLVKVGAAIRNLKDNLGN